MECQICNIRSADGFCHICQRLVCEECGHTCYRCGKMACTEHGEVGRSGRWRCDACSGERRSRQAAAPDLSSVPAAAAPDEEEVEFEEVPVPVRRIELEPWKASVTIGIVAIVVTAAFAFISEGVPWPFLVVAALGAVWAVIGIAGAAYVNKGLSGLGLGLNIVPMAIAALVGVTGLSGARTEPRQEVQVESLTPQKLLEMRRRKHQEDMERLRMQRSGQRHMIVPAAPPAAPPAEQEQGRQ